FAAVIAMFSLFVFKRPAKAQPTMIRLGYSNCAVCHISPQGGGLLNAYGRSVDQAQSLAGGDYRPADGRLARWLGGKGHITQDVRSVTQVQVSKTTDKPLVDTVRSRLMYRNATELGDGFRLSAVVMSENESSKRPALGYESAIQPRTVYVTSALLSYRPKNTLEFSVGRDQLPSGINISDLTVLIRSHNRMGYYDAPLQAKLFWWGKRYQITPYAFAPAGPEESDERESGAGSLAELDLLGKGSTVVGANALHGSSRSVHRTMVGPYARLGFGAWGILAEHDITQRKLTDRPANFLQHASYAQLFWYPREWLVLSVIGEQLKVGRPFPAHLYDGRFEVTSRLSNHVTLGLTSRLEHNVITRQRTRSVALQLALKTVQ
ncbi:MAG TPA: hypothetical protein VFA71_10085, partial [Terriglobales bacterium]|nr:hypothetical protein [Terriglobales bacterium]